MAGCARSTRYGLKFESFRVYVCGTQCAQRALGFRVWKFYSLFYCMQRARLQGSKVPGFQGCRVPESLRVPGCQGSKVSGFHSRRVPRFQGFRVPRFRGSRVPGFQGSGVPRFQGSRVPGFQGSRVPGSHGFRVPRFPGFQGFQGFQGFRVPGSQQGSRCAGLQGSKVPGFQGCRVPESLRVPGCQGSKVSGFHGRRLPRFQGFRVPGFRGSKVPGFQGSRFSRIPKFQGSIPDFEGCKSPRASPSPRDWNPTGPAVGNYKPVWKPEPIDHHESGLVTTNHHYKWYSMIYKPLLTITNQVLVTINHNHY